MRECTGLDEFAAVRKFIGKAEDEKVYQPWEIIARCIVELDGSKGCKGYEELLKLSTKDLNVLLLAYNQLNTPTPEELKEIRGFFPTT
uniref:Uncharacterized protein n=1 Tax=candidate division WOR-3 bacterium TaxID=2052148 RepID=A0A7C6A8G2_UNCW3